MKKALGRRIRRAAIAGLVLCGLVMAGSGIAVQGLRNTLLSPDSTYAVRLRLDKGDKRLLAIRGLELIRTKKAVQTLLEFLVLPDGSCAHKREALMALGRIGNTRAIDAIGAFEEWAQARRKDAPDMRLDTQDFGVYHFDQITLPPLAECVDASGKKWALVSWNRYAPCELWLTPVKDGQVAGRPLTLDPPATLTEEAFGQLLRDKRLELHPGEHADALAVSFGGEAVSYSLTELAQDSDRDGFPDIRERHLGSDPNNPDSDGDGVKDGEDPAPLTPKTNVLDDAAQIRQAVFTLCFATTNARSTLHIGSGKEVIQEYHGYLGTLLNQGAEKESKISVGIFVEEIAGNTARVGVSDYEGPLAAASATVTVRKVKGKWVATNFEMGSIA